MSRLLLVCLAVVVGFWPRVGVGGHGSEEPVSTVTLERVKYYLDAREPLILIDLRPVKEFQQRRIPGARSVPMKELDKRFREIPQSGRVVLYCDCPQNQIIEEVFQLLKDYGYRNTAVMADGFQGWVKLRYPLESGRE